MKPVNTHAAKARLSRFLAALKSGEILILCNRNRPQVWPKTELVPRRTPVHVDFGVVLF